jgi:hypothetical protein
MVDRSTEHGQRRGKTLWVLHGRAGEIAEAFHDHIFGY